MVNTYLRNGIATTYLSLHSAEVKTLREEIEELFTFHQYPSELDIDQFASSELCEKLVDLIFGRDELDRFLRDIESELGLQHRSLAVLPRFTIQRNNFSLPEYGNHGWHRDCGGEKNYKYCKEILQDPGYVFGKFGCYLQSNTSYGGQIDYIKRSHIFGRRLRTDFLGALRHLVWFIFRQLSIYGSKIFKLKYDLTFFSPGFVRLNIEPGRVIAFDSGILHRSTPIESAQVNRLSIDSLQCLRYKRQIKTSLQSNNKYAIYCHFGSKEAVDSYMYDRLKRVGNHGELISWLNQIELLGPDLRRQANDTLHSIQIKNKMNYSHTHRP